METNLITWYNSPKHANVGWRFRLDCCGFSVISESSFDTEDDAKGFANHLVDKFLNQAPHENVNQGA